MPFKSNQKGFAAVETVLIVIVLAIVGAAGYYVYHATSKTTEALNAAQLSAETATPHKKKTEGGKGGNGAQTGPAKAEVLIINEWGVAAEIPTPPETAALIQHKLVDGPPAAALFTTQELIDATGGTDCTADEMPAGMIVRAKGGDIYYNEGGAPSGKTVTQQIATGSLQPYTKVGDYYYWYVHSQAACGDPAKTAKLQQVAANEVKIILNNLQKE